MKTGDSVATAERSVAHMGWRQVLRVLGTVVLLALVAYFYFSEVSRNWTAVRSFRPSISMPFLLLALALYLVSYLLEIYIWRQAVNRHQEGLPLPFPESIAVVNASGFFKYLPGRIWT